MAQPEKKRRLPTKVAAMKARKRRKLDGDAPSAVKPEAKPSRGHIVRLDDLAWKEVAMPDRIDDYEGFFGLEEIEDVEVVRSAGTGKVSFKIAGNSKETSEQDESAAVADGLTETAEDDQEDTVEAEDDEWIGFSEEEEDGELQVGDEVVPKPVSTKTADLQKEQKPNRKQKKDAASADMLDLGTVPFQGLEDETLEDTQDLSAWDSLELSRETLSSLSKLGFTRPTPIQSAAIPEVLAGHDVIGKASTGSGKTLAFGIPILEHYLDTRRHNDRGRKSRGKEYPPLALILSPTRELAHQLSAHLTALCSGGSFDGPAVATLTGGLSLQKQQRLLSTADIVIGTPGRLWEIISEGHGTLERFKSIKFLVVDEADRLLSEGHFKEVEEILNVLDQRNEEEESASDDAEERGYVKRQTLVFSATFHKGLQQRLAGKAKHGGDLMDRKESMEYLLRKLNFREEKPKFIDVNPISQMAEGLKEALVECAGMEKDLYLYALLLLQATPNPPRTLVFTNSISAVRRLHPLLTNLGLPALALHSQMPQKARLRSIERFSSQPGSILIATDVAARGLDIPGVQLVIHYHLPRTADMYVHRSGRTARAENSGSSILICAPEEVAGVRRLIAKVHAKSSGGDGGASKHFIRTLDLDRRVIARLKPRVTLAKKLADTTTAKEKATSSSNSLFREAAEDLGVEYNSEELEEGAKGRQGRGKGRKRKEREARSLSKAETSALRAELKALLSQRVNVGVSERYITGGRVDVDALLRGEKGEFLGHVDGLEDL